MASSAVPFILNAEKPPARLYGPDLRFHSEGLPRSSNSGRNTPKWDLVDCQYWALSKKQYHGPYTEEAWQAMYGTMRTADSLANIQVPALILKADAPPETRRVHQEAASAMRNGKLVHIDGAGHNLHHDELARTVEVVNEFLSTL